jgi:hypothetical protein
MTMIKSITITVAQGDPELWIENPNPYWVARCAETQHLVTADDEATAVDMMLELLRDELKAQENLLQHAVIH